MLGVTLPDGSRCACTTIAARSARWATCARTRCSICRDGVLHNDGTHRVRVAWRAVRLPYRRGSPASGRWPLPVYEVRIEDGRVLVGPA